MSLSESLTELTLDISDKNKTIELLTRLINEQKGRHDSEAAKFQEEMEASLSRTTKDSDDKLRNLFKSNESLLQKKKALGSRVEELILQTKDAETKKKASMESVRQDLADAKEREHRLHQQQKADREKVCYHKLSIVQATCCYDCILILNIWIARAFRPGLRNDSLI